MKTPQIDSLLKRISLLACLAVFALMTLGCGGEEPGAHSDGTHSDTVQTVSSHTHENPEETCFLCDPAKREKGRLWCKEHGRYEDRCWQCHPELEDKDRLFCTEHFLYEDECFICHPELAPGDDVTAGEASSNAATESTASSGSGGLFCKEHNVPEAECAICHPDLAASLKPGGNLKVRFPSKASAEKVGIRTGQPRLSEAPPAIDAICEVQYNLNTLARITPLAGGVVRKVMHDVGDNVEAGEVLVELHSATAAATKSDYLSAAVMLDIARQAFEREKQLREQNIAAEKDFLEAQATFRTAQLTLNNVKQKLVNIGFTAEELAEIERTQDTSATLVIRAPFSGTVVERASVVGESVEVGQTLFTVADLSTRWLELSIAPANLDRIHVGQTVETRFAELPGLTICGEITWVDSAIDPRSRMVRARALVTADIDRIKTGLYGQARIATGEQRPATMVPRDAVQKHEGVSFVFVQNDPDLFSLRRVALGQTTGDTVEVLGGLGPNDPVVTDGSFIVMSEFLKSRLGAGCTDH
jgi:cobalt-zinc-cadmium efflux system membrane fusion protein